MHRNMHSLRPLDVTNHPLFARWMNEGVRLDMQRYGVPLCLHHYTSWAGFTGIVTNRALRATDTRYVNDRAELSYGMKACRAALAPLSDTPFQVHARLIGRGLEEGFGYSTFVACLSASETLDSQWQRYADGGKGFSVGFDVACLSALWADPALRILPVEYDETVQAERARAAVSRAISDLHALGDDLQRNFDFHCRSRFSLLAVELVYLCATFKSEEWKAEHEWRLVYQRSGPNALPVETRIGPDGVRIPFVSFDLTRTIDRQPRRIFESIRVGPRVSAEVARCARALLEGEQPPVVWSAHPHEAVPNRHNIVAVR